MRLFIITQYVYHSPGPLIETDVPIGYVLAEDRESAKAAVPPSAHLHEDWHALDPAVREVGEFNFEGPYPVFLDADLPNLPAKET